MKIQTVGEHMSNKVVITVLSEPTTFATRREKEWKEAIFEAVSKFHIPQEITGLELDFRVSSTTRNGHPFDLDNLCEPVFSALANSNWFGGRKTKIKWWKATRKVGQPSGVTISGGKYGLLSVSKIIVQGRYSCNLPRSGRDEVFTSWVESLKQEADLTTLTDGLGVMLRFGSDKVHIADIVTGRVKNIIDCLYPLIGGKAGAPHDWKIDCLYVEKGVADLSEKELEVSLYEMS